MKPVAIFRHVSHEGPGHLADFLEARGIPWQLIAVDRGDAIPASPAAYSGLVFMGGPMSANDTLSWIADELTIIRQAVTAGIPVLGHCLGSQLMAKALGAQVVRNPVKEIGWGTVRPTSAPESSDWLDGTAAFSAFHWHGETFTLPNGAARILETEHCANQGFVLDGLHLGLQCHVEMTEPMIREWCTVGSDEIAASDSPAVQPEEQILAEIPENLPTLNTVADQLYGHWVKGLRP